MSFLSKFTLDGDTYTVLSCTYSFNQQTDSTGIIRGITQGGQIELILESRGDTNILNWMLIETQMKEGTITFFKRDAMAKLLEIQFFDAFCVNYKENFSSDSGKPMNIEITISAQKLKIGDLTYKKRWGDHH